jgi:hypothetical protein
VAVGSGAPDLFTMRDRVSLHSSCLGFVFFDQHHTGWYVG